MGLKPPEDVSEVELFHRMLERPVPSEVIKFPRQGEDFSVRILALPKRQLDTINMMILKQLRESKSFTMDELKNPVVSDLVGVGDRVAREVLAQAVVGVKPAPGTENRPEGPVYPRMFRDADHVSALSDTELELLFGAFWLVKDRFSPDPSKFDSEEEINAWVDKLGSAGGHFLLCSLQLPQLVALTSLLADRVRRVSAIQTSPRENWEQSLESLLSSWSLGTNSSTGHVADESSYPPSDHLLTQEEAKRRAQEFYGPEFLRAAKAVAKAMKD